jgi:hypothetical protein
MKTARTCFAFSILFFAFEAVAQEADTTGFKPIHGRHRTTLKQHTTVQVGVGLTFPRATMIHRTRKY